MKDLILERLHGWRYDTRRRDYRCPVCGCIVGERWCHKVRLGLLYQVLTTCASYYCRAQDDIRYG